MIVFGILFRSFLTRINGIRNLTCQTSIVDFPIHKFLIFIFGRFFELYFFGIKAIFPLNMIIDLSTQIFLDIKLPQTSSRYIAKSSLPFQSEFSKMHQKMHCLDLTSRKLESVSSEYVRIERNSAVAPSCRIFLQVAFVSYLELYRP